MRKTLECVRRRLAPDSGAFGRARRSIATVTLTLCALGCASGRAFVPTEHVTALSPEGRRPAAEYSVRSDSHTVAEVKVWSLGATRNTTEEDDGATVIRVGFEIHNQTQAPVRLDTRRLALEQVKLPATTIARVPALRIEGSPEIGAGAEGQALAVFRLPGDVWPDDVVDYRVAWTLTNGGTYAQKTPFVGVVGRYYDVGYPYDLYPYDYYYYPPPYLQFYYGVHPGWYWHRHRGWPGWRYRRYYRP